MKRWKKGLFIGLFSSLLWEQHAVEAAVGLTRPATHKYKAAYPPTPVLVTAKTPKPQAVPSEKWERFIPDPAEEGKIDPQEAVQTRPEAESIRAEIAEQAALEARLTAERKQQVGAAANRRLASRGELTPVAPAPAPEPVSNSAPTMIKQQGVSTPRAANVITVALRYQGTPYQFGGTTPAGFDCSGFIQYVMQQFGVALPRTTYQQIDAGPRVSRANLRPGDLVFFAPGGSATSHAGIYMGNGQFIHADQSRGITVSDLNEGYWAGVYQAAARVS